MNSPLMTRFHARCLLLPLLVIGLASRARAADPPPLETARGVVFHDANHNRQRDDGEKGIPNIRVSNGREITRTNARGEYKLPVDNDDILFVIKPRNWRTPVNRSLLPQFFYVHKPQGSPKLKFPGVKPTGPLPKSVDFPLYPKAEPNKFQAILFGDPQPRNKQELNYISHDVVEELIGSKAAFGVTLGDIVFDDLSLLKPQARRIAMIGIPWYNVIGNHDINLDAKNDKQSDETFERVFGPSYYSFDYGPVHFLVLDDIEWFVPKGGKKGSYRGGLGNEQMTFIRNDLAAIPSNQFVVLMMHIPLVGVRDRQELYRLIEKRPLCVSISGHTHYHQHVFIDRRDGWQGPKPHHHIINVTVSGSWWSGAPDERGIPHTMMRDGAPNGYSILTFNGDQYTLDFKAAGRSAKYQMNIHAPETVALTAVAKTAVHVNVFNGSERSKVEMQVGGSDWIAMTRTLEVDPFFARLKQTEDKVPGKSWRNLPNTVKSSHLWKAQLPARLKPGVHLLRVRTKDMHGRSFWGSRILQVTPVEQPRPAKAAAGG